MYVEMPFSEYLNRMFSNGTNGDELTLRTASELYKIEITLISTLGPEAQVTITPTDFCPFNRITLGHFAEECGEHYVVLGENETVEGSEEDNETFERRGEVNEALENREEENETDEGSEGGNETVTLDRPELDTRKPMRLRHSIGSPSLSYCIRKVRNSNFDDLPPEIIKTILMLVLQCSDNNWPSHIVATYAHLRNVCKFWRIVCDSERLRKFLPRVYVPYKKILPQKKASIASNSIRVSMLRIVKSAGSFSGLVIELKTILNHPKWNTAWLNLQLLAYGWYIIENIVWKSKK